MKFYGIVKWFDDAKGYGFITPEDGEAEIFVHFTGIVTDGFKTLIADQRVSYEPVSGPKGMQARNVRTAI